MKKYFVFRPITRTFNFDDLHSKYKSDRESLVCISIHEEGARWLIARMDELSSLNKLNSNRSPEITSLTFNLRSTLAQSVNFGVSGIFDVNEDTFQSTSQFDDPHLHEDGVIEIPEDRFQRIQNGESTTLIIECYIREDGVVFDFNDDFGKLEMYDIIPKKVIENLTLPLQLQNKA